MTPTRVGTLVAVVLGAFGLVYLVVVTSYGSLPSATVGAPITVALLALAELALAKVVRDRVQHRPGPTGRPPRRALHPLQVARAAALAKASSLTGAVVLGGYGGLFAWTAPRTGALAAAAADAPVAAGSALAGLALMVCALLLERACRVPEPPEERAGLGSGA